MVEEPFRLIIAKSKEDESKEYWFISNDFDFEMSAKEIADAYRRRWDIDTQTHNVLLYITSID